MAKSNAIHDHAVTFDELLVLSDEEKIVRQKEYHIEIMQSLETVFLKGEHRGELARLLNFCNSDIFTEIQEDFNISLAFIYNSFIDLLQPICTALVTDLSKIDTITKSTFATALVTHDEQMTSIKEYRDSAEEWLMNYFYLLSLSNIQSILGLRLVLENECKQIPWWNVVQKIRFTKLLRKLRIK